MSCVARKLNHAFRFEPITVAGPVTVDGEWGAIPADGGAVAEDQRMGVGDDGDGSVRMFADEDLARFLGPWGWAMDRPRACRGGSLHW